MNRCPVCGWKLIKSDGPIGETDRGYARCSYNVRHYSFGWSGMNSLIEVWSPAFFNYRRFYNRRKTDKDPHDPLPEDVKKAVDHLRGYYKYECGEDYD